VETEAYMSSGDLTLSIAQEHFNKWPDGPIRYCSMYPGGGSLEYYMMPLIYMLVELARKIGA
jgi:hypothetical protein